MILKAIAFFAADCNLARLHSAAVAVVRWPGVLLSVCRIRVLYGNGFWYGHSCHGMRIGNRTQASD